jgi:asparagine synthase (glutamine-hydrolysing)
MCGIAGIAGAFDPEWAKAAVGKMTRELAHRGPDAEGVYAWDGAVLGHRRLSIFDLSDAGRQPMVSSDGAVGVVFNGAIYNFLELRAELESRGCTFRSRTDTETLLHGYREWGIDRLVSRLRGMFAIGLWDQRAGRLFLVRDRLGVKPLVYVPLPGGIAFASTVRALRATGHCDAVDEQAMVEYLEYGYVTDERTIYSGAKKLAAASILEWSGRGISVRQYWSPPAAAESGGPSLGEAAEETERLLLKAVERRLYADVPVGSLLSGGVDSSLVCWAVSKLGADLTAFTISTPGDPWDEAGDARRTAQELGLRHQVIEMSPETPLEIPELISAYGEPFACASALGMLRVSRAVKGAATVLLTGDGGDDVFLGYPEHRRLWIAERLAKRIPGAAAAVWRGTRSLPLRSGVLRRPVHLLNYATGGLAAVAMAHDGLPYYQRHGLLGERLTRARLPGREVAWSHGSARRLLTEFLEYDRRGRFVGEYMTKVDGATMYYALEARSPFLDHELWEFTASLPFRVRLAGGRLKAVLRELALRRLGKRVARGVKRGFGIPVQRWIVGPLRGAVEEALRDSVLDRCGYIRAEAAQRQLAAAARNGWAPQQLWYVYVLEAWFRRNA